MRSHLVIFCPEWAWRRLLYRSVATGCRRHRAGHGERGRGGESEARIEIQLTEKELFEHAPTDEQQDEAEEDEQQAADEADEDVHMAVAESEDEA